MKFTIREIIDGVAIVDFEDGVCASVPMASDDTEAAFIRKASEYATKTFTAPDWVNSESSIDGATVERTVDTSEINGEDDYTEFYAEKAEYIQNRMAAYGTPESQLEFITENGLEAWQEEVADIKSANPKNRKLEGINAR